MRVGDDSEEPRAPRNSRAHCVPRTVGYFHTIVVTVSPALPCSVAVMPGSAAGEMPHDDRNQECADEGEENLESEWEAGGSRIVIGSRRRG